jgi:hypothetical protein
MASNLILFYPDGRVLGLVVQTLPRPYGLPVDTIACQKIGTEWAWVRVFYSTLGRDKGNQWELLELGEVPKQYQMTALVYP